MPGSQSGEYYKGKPSPIRQRHRKLMATHKLIQNIVLKYKITLENGMQYSNIVAIGLEY